MNATASLIAKTLKALTNIQIHPHVLKASTFSPETP